MLKLMRDNLKNLKWVLWFVVFVFVLLVFTEWGSGRGSGPRGMVGLAAKVGEVRITEADFLRELRSTEQRYREMFGEQWESFREQMDLAAMTLQNMVDRELLILEGRRMGLRVTCWTAFSRFRPSSARMAHSWARSCTPASCGPTNFRRWNSRLPSARRCCWNVCSRRSRQAS